MRTKRYKTILFDMDGTLADTDQMLIASMNDLYDRFNDGKRRPVEEMYYFSGPPIKQTLAKEFPQLDLEFIFQEFLKVSRPYYDTHVFIFDYEKEVLLRLKEAGIRLGVVTNKTHELTMVTIKNIGLEGVFDVVIGYDDVKNIKPNKEGIIKACNLLSGDLKTTLYLGDNAIDLETANNAGVDCCLVNWGPRVLADDVKPKYKINSYLELEDIVYE